VAAAGETVAVKVMSAPAVVVRDEAARVLVVVLELLELSELPEPQPVEVSAPSSVVSLAL
jgi:hypothetical protein